MTSALQAVARIAAVTRTVPDIGVASRFYRDALGFVAAGPTSEIPQTEADLLGAGAGRVSRLPMRLGEQEIVLLGFAPPGVAYPDGSTSTDLWFQHCAVVVADMERAYGQVLRAGGRPITQGGPLELPANTGGVAAFKFRDPFGHPWELLAFPEGVGDPVWHARSSDLHRGIDHTAIAVLNLEASRDFYADVLGLAVAGQTHNRGAAQSRLDAVRDDDVDVLALNPEAIPPHLELLAYRTGARRPLGNTAPADAALTRTVAIGPVDAIADRLMRSGHQPAAVRRGTWDGRPAVAFADPDGHRWIRVAPLGRRQSGQPSWR